MRTLMKTFAIALLVLAPVRVFAQTAESPASTPEERRAAAAAPGEPGTDGNAVREGTGLGGPNTPEGKEGEAEEEDPSEHFNFFGFEPGHLFDYMGKDQWGGKFGDGTMTDPKTGVTVKEEEPASPPYVFMLINFAIFLLLLAKYLRPVGHKAAQERHDLIKSALDEAAKLRKQAADKLAEYETRLKDADAEIAKLVEGMRKDAEADKQRILAAAETQAAQMKRDADLRIAAEIEAARAALRAEVAAAAAGAAEKILREKMQPGDQQKLVGNFITDVQGAAARKEAR